MAVTVAERELKIYETYFSRASLVRSVNVCISTKNVIHRKMGYNAE